jgi:hypothetical protein
MFLLDTITRIMTEKCHEGLHRHAGVGQLGGPGVAKLMSDDSQRQAVGAGEAGGDHGITKTSLDPGHADATAALDEDEIGEVSVAWVRSGAVAAAVSEPVVERFESGVVDRD